MAFECGADGGDGDGEQHLFTIAQLEARFGAATVTSVLQCAGNRASEDIAATGPSGFTGTVFETITQGMVGNARWTGARAFSGTFQPSILCTREDRRFLHGRAGGGSVLADDLA